jgi:hypothetical protein
MSRADILALVADQFTEVSQRLDTQLTRIAQLQQQLDQQKTDIVETRADVARIRELLRDVAKSA